MHAFGRRSMERLLTCHPLLRELFERVIARPDLPLDLTVLCGHRGAVEQAEAVASGASKLHYPHSRHNVFPSLAVDVAPWVDGAVSWAWEDYHQIAPAVKAEWALMQVEGATGAWSLVWGGDWASPHDGPHWELRA